MTPKLGMQKISGKHKWRTILQTTWPQNCQDLKNRQSLTPCYGREQTERLVIKYKVVSRLGSWDIKGTLFTKVKLGHFLEFS